jgi:hypothetical protein
MVELSCLEERKKERKKERERKKREREKKERERERKRSNKLKSGAFRPKNTDMTQPIRVDK